MKIVHVTGYFQPWLGYQEYFLAKKQKELGHEVYIITSDKHAPYHHFSDAIGSFFKSKNVCSGRSNERGIWVYRLPSLLQFGYAILVSGMRKTLQQIRPTVVHIHEIHHLIPVIPLFFKNSFKFSLILDSHRYKNPTADAGQKNKTLILKCLEILYHKLFKIILLPYIKKKVDIYIAVTPLCCTWLSKEFGVERHNVLFIPLGADSEIFKKDQEVRRKTRQNLGVKDNEILVIYAGKMTPDKGIHLLLHAIASLIHRHKELKLLLLGSIDVNYLTNIKSIIDNYGISSNIIFHGIVSNEKLSDYYNASDVGVWPGSPSITIIEAMATGLPVIIAQSKNTNHLLEYKNGLCLNELYFPKGDVRHLRVCLEKLITNEKLRSKLGLLCREIVMAKYDWDSLARRTLRIYEDVTAKHKNWRA